MTRSNETFKDHFEFYEEEKSESEPGDNTSITDAQKCIESGPVGFECQSIGWKVDALQ